VEPNRGVGVIRYQVHGLSRQKRSAEFVSGAGDQ
jgi:hypothetical protein